jgi:Protein of unknown function (DUF3489)
VTKSKRTHNVKAASATKSRPTASDAKKPAQPKSRANSKQAEVIAMLSRPQGSTIPAIIKVTGWQQHSVRGSLQGSCARSLASRLSPQRPTASESTASSAARWPNAKLRTPTVGPRSHGSAVDRPAAIEAEIERIRSLGLEAPRARWRSMFGAAPPLVLTKDIPLSRTSSPDCRGGAEIIHWTSPAQEALVVRTNATD